MVPRYPCRSAHVWRHLHRCDRPSRRRGCSQVVRAAPLCRGEPFFVSPTSLPSLLSGKKAERTWHEGAVTVGNVPTACAAPGVTGPHQPQSDGPTAPPTWQSGAGQEKPAWQSRAGQVSPRQRLAESLSASVPCTCRGPSPTQRSSEKGQPPPVGCPRNQGSLWRLEIPAEPQAVRAPCVLAEARMAPLGRRLDSSHVQGNKATSR